MLDILFINPTDRCDLRTEVNGTLILATKLLQAGFRVQVLRFGEIEGYNKDYEGFIECAVEQIQMRKPRCVSFYTLWTDYHIMLHIAKTIKQRAGDITVVFGGPQASATAADAMKVAPYIDYICTGEGEDTVVPFFQAVLNGQKPDAVPGVYYRSGGETVVTPGQQPLCDLNSLPYWDEGLYTAANNNMSSAYYYMPIDAGRGCPYNCTFCCTSHFWRRTYRLKSPQRIVEDIRYYKEKYGIRSFWFSHDAFTINRPLVMEVCDRIIAEKLDITWRCSARVDSITPELIQKMKQAGLAEIELGVETGSKRMQKLTNKNLDLNKLKDTIQLLLDTGLTVGLFFMYGFPEETQEDLNDTLKLMFDLTDMGVQRMNAAYTRFNPATAITQQYFDDLVFDPSVKVLFRKTFGYKEQEQFIKENKALFPCYFHLPTKVRNEYQYVIFFYYLYQQYPKSARVARKLYQGDYLQMYRDFYEKNIEAFLEDADRTAQLLLSDSFVFWKNMLQERTESHIPQLLGFMEYEGDLQKLKTGKQDLLIDKVYDFDFLEYKLGVPLERLSPGKTRLVLERKDGKIMQRMLGTP